MALQIIYLGQTNSTPCMWIEINSWINSTSLEKSYMGSQIKSFMKRILLYTLINNVFFKQGVNQKLHCYLPNSKSKTILIELYIGSAKLTIWKILHFKYTWKTILHDDYNFSIHCQLYQIIANYHHTFIIKQQVVGQKTPMSYDYPSHVVNSSLLSNQDQTLTHFKTM